GVLLREGLDLLAAQLSALEQLVPDGVVLGELLELAVAEQIDAAVADVRDEAAIADDEQGAQRGAHAALVGVVERLLVDVDAGPLHGLLEKAQELPRWDAALTVLGGELLLDEVLSLAQLLVQRANGERARHLPGRVPSHSVRDHEKRELLVHEEVVFVVVARAVDVRLREKAEVLLGTHGGGPSLPKAERHSHAGEGHARERAQGRGQ